MRCTAKEAEKQADRFWVLLKGINSLPACSCRVAGEEKEKKKKARSKQRPLQPPVGPPPRQFPTLSECTPVVLMFPQANPLTRSFRYSLALPAHMNITDCTPSAPHSRDLSLALV